MKLNGRELSHDEIMEAMETKMHGFHGAIYFPRLFGSEGNFPPEPLKHKGQCNHNHGFWNAGIFNCAMCGYSTGPKGENRHV